MSSVVVMDWNLVVPNLEHSVLRCLMADTFCSVCTVDWFGVMSVDMVVLVQQRHDGKVVLMPIETTNKSA